MCTSTVWECAPHPHSTHTFTFMHLADAFIQSDLHCIRVTVLHLISSCFPWESNPWSTGKPLSTHKHLQFSKAGCTLYKIDHLIWASEKNPTRFLLFKSKLTVKSRAFRSTEKTKKPLLHTHQRHKTVSRIDNVNPMSMPIFNET